MFSILFIVVWFTTFGADATGVPDCPPLVVPTSDGGVTFLGGFLGVTVFDGSGDTPAFVFRVSKFGTVLRSGVPLLVLNSWKVSILNCLIAL